MHTCPINTWLGLPCYADLPDNTGITLAIALLAIPVLLALSDLVVPALAFLFPFLRMINLEDEIRQIVRAGEGQFKKKEIRTLRRQIIVSGMIPISWSIALLAVATGPAFNIAPWLGYATIIIAIVGFLPAAAIMGHALLDSYRN